MYKINVYLYVCVLTQYFCLSFQVIVYDHGQVIEDSALTGRVGFTGKGSVKPLVQLLPFLTRDRVAT